MGFSHEASQQSSVFGTLNTVSHDQPNHS